MADKSAYIQLYDNEEKKDAYKWQIENKQAGVSIKDSKAGRPMKFFADSFKFSASIIVPICCRPSVCRASRIMLLMCCS